MADFMADFINDAKAFWPQYRSSILYFFWPLIIVLFLSILPILFRSIGIIGRKAIKLLRRNVLLGAPQQTEETDEMAPIQDGLLFDVSEFLEYFFFGVFGVAIAYIEVRIGGLLAQGVLPGLITIVTVLIQLVSRSVPALDVPLDKRKSLANATLVCLGFLFAFEYFKIARPPEGAKAAETATYVAPNA